MSRGPQAVALYLSEPERARLQRLLRRHGTGQASAQRVRIILACAQAADPAPGPRPARG